MSYLEDTMIPRGMGIQTTVSGPLHLRKIGASSQEPFAGEKLVGGIMASKARLWLAIGAGAIVLIVLYNLFGYSPPAGRALSYSELLKETEAGRVIDVFIHGEELSGHRSGGEQFHSIIPDQPQVLIDALVRSGATIAIAPDASNPLLGLVLSWLPFALFIGVLVYYLRRIPQSLRTSVDRLDAVASQLAQLRRAD